MKDIFETLFEKLSSMPTNQELDYSLEAFDGYYGILEDDGIQAYVDSLNRKKIAFLEVESTPETVRLRYPKMYGDTKLESTAMNAMAISCLGLEIGSDLTTLVNWAEREPAHKLHRAKSDQSVYRISVRKQGFLITLSIENSILSGFAAYDTVAVYEAAELPEERRPKTDNEVYEYF